MRNLISASKNKKTITNNPGKTFPKAPAPPTCLLKGIISKNQNKHAISFKYRQQQKIITSKFYKLCAEIKLIDFTLLCLLTNIDVKKKERGKTSSSIFIGRQRTLPPLAGTFHTHIQKNDSLRSSAMYFPADARQRPGSRWKGSSVLRCFLRSSGFLLSGHTQRSMWCQQRQRKSRVASVAGKSTTTAAKILRMCSPCSPLHQWPRFEAIIGRQEQRKGHGYDKMQ